MMISRQLTDCADADTLTMIIVMIDIILFIIKMVFVVRLQRYKDNLISRDIRRIIFQSLTKFNNEDGVGIF